MQIKESELALLEAIHFTGTVTGPDLVKAMSETLSKQHIYVLLSRLEQSNLVTGDYESTGRRGPPQRRYQLTPAGKSVRVAAKKLVDELSAAGRTPEVSWQPHQGLVAT